MTPAAHIPVLLDAVMAALALSAGETYVDGTFGAGGYARAALARGSAHVHGFDRDPAAAAPAAALAADYPGGVTLWRERFSQMARVLGAHGVAQVDAVALDIGVSSMQLDEAERGFSFMADGPLDMRMGADGPTAADFINAASEGEIADVIFRLGEEPKARRIARAIVADRPLTRTSELARLVRSVCGPQPGGKDPSTRTFQALRIHINDELAELDAGLAAAERLLRPGGRLAVVSFHSLEDRAVKNFLRERSGSAPGGSRHRPQSVALRTPTFARPVKAVRASDDEARRNPRARSATLRAAVRTTAPAWHSSTGGNDMIIRFGSVLAGVATLATVLGCYTVSLKVSGERKAVDDLRARIAADSRGVRTLEAELRTRARLPELQRWNDEVLALGAPAAAQLVRDPVQLASFAAAAPRAATPAIAEGPAPRFAIAEAPAAAPSPVRTVAYAPRLAAADVSPPRVAPVERAAPVVQTAAVKLASRHSTLLHRAAPAARPSIVAGGLDTALTGVVAAAAASERAGLTQVALR